MIRATPGAGPLTQIDPRLRLVAALAFALVVVTLDGVTTLLAALGLATLLAVLARVPARATARRLVAVDSLMLVVFLTVPFSVAGTPLWTIGPFVATREGSIAALVLVLRANAILLAVLALVATLSPMRLGRALAALRLPASFVDLLALTARYIEVLAAEFQRLRRAMLVRGFRPRASRHGWRSLAWLVGMLLVRGFERGERVHWAMRCRGYAGRMPAAPPAPFAPGDLLFAALFLVAATALFLADRP